MKAVRCLLKDSPGRWMDFPLVDGGTLANFITQARFEGFAFSVKGNMFVSYDQIAAAFEIESAEPLADFTRRAMQ